MIASISQLAPQLQGMDARLVVVTLIVLGILFLAAEILVLPGFGVAGIIGVLLLAGGSVAAWLSFGAVWGGITILGTVVLTVVLAVVAFRSKLLRKRFVLDTRLERGRGTDAEDLKGLVGKSGTAHTDLRPAGIADVDERRVDGVSEGGFIDRGSRIVVTEVDGPRVVVARKE